ncbi:MULTISPECIES: hypothetical protein [unclassified Candidatus Frackibacter]|uniref:hypothetical protein n=1 Tax=unclassified Candidatus Frackibacter TaxID=2648818 RepID=UPI000791F81C|nr:MULTISPECIES: hypothetical protein [unclassified Candidatus Frackibacter]KXS41743.1 MAG: hypothetical protein AWU54_1543 [Candidatus Frackibacter sp. T328-2]SDC17665.1 hypothetical protein SAMN04515661_103103 [Candidatus Frackibacter sp. WG11]SEM44292.1 hypothetical protein SAMN04488698_10437 [Candidatus Frackibacter sp. WG12]SFL46831.1 hypothetical protein SAMN04488699_10337 [Candidatus Frackibacter sp. WG13]
MKSRKFLRRGLVLTVMVLLLVLTVIGCSPQATDQAEDGAQDEAQDTADAAQNEENKQNAERVAKLEEKLKVVTQDNSDGKGCIGCHEAGSEYSLQKEIDGIEGHPQVEAKELSDCMQCHASGNLAFKRLIHEKHLVEGDHYKEEYDKNCINCHKISENGEINVRGLDGKNGEDKGNGGNEDTEGNGNGNE